MLVFALGPGAPATHAQAPSIGIDPILLPEPDLELTLLVPAAMGRATAAPLFARIRNVGSAPALLSDVEAGVRFVAGGDAGRVVRQGSLPTALAPSASAWVRMRWEAPEAGLRRDETLVVFACVAAGGADADRSNDCDSTLRSGHVRTERIAVDDDFETPSTRWEWWTNGTGASVVADGVAAFEVSAESRSDAYSDSEINDYRRGYERGFPWGPGIHMEIRARSSDDNGRVSGMGRGTRGFGFWNLETGGASASKPMSNVWFLSASPETLGVGIFAAIVFDRGEATLLAPLDIDLRQWHDYEIVWTSNGATFFVDDRPLAATPRVPKEALGFVAWIDNYRFVFTPDGIVTRFLDLDRDQTLSVDRVRISTLAEGVRLPPPSADRLSRGERAAR